MNETWIHGDLFLRFNDVQKKVGLSRTTIYDWIRAGNFPKPQKIGRRCSVWRLSVINEWMRRQAGEQ